MNLIGVLRRAINHQKFNVIFDETPSRMSGVVVNGDTALAHSAVYACTSLIGNAIASMPIQAYRKIRARDVRDPIATPQWLDPDNGQPNPEQDVVTFIFRLLTSVLLDGNTFALITARDNLGFPSEVYPVHPLSINVERDSRRRVVYEHVDGRVFQRFSAVSPSGQLFHVKGYDSGQLRGLSPIQAYGEGIGAAVAADRYAARFFGNGAHPGGVVELTGQHVQPDDETLTQIADQFQRSHSGERQHLPVVLHNAKWQQMSVNPDDAQLIESRQWGVNEVARCYLCPPHLIADMKPSTAWGTGLEEQNRAFLTYGLLRWMKLYETMLSQMRPRGQFIRFNADGFLRGDTLERFRAHAVGRQWGWLSANEIRRLEDLPPIDDGDRYLEPLNMVAVGEGPSLKQRVDAAAKLTQYGYNPTDALELVGLDPIRHLGYLPNSLQSELPPTPDEELEPV